MRNIIWPTIVGVLVAIILLQQYPNLGENAENAAITAAPQQQEQNYGPVSYASAVELAAPAVVNIYTSTIIKQRLHPLFDDPFFRRFFGLKSTPQRKRMQNSLGSGVIVSGAGYVLTNNHVIAGADKIVVAMRDGREAHAKLVGSDADTDLAVLKIDLPELPTITLTSSDELNIGDVVLAIGNPFGVGQTVTMGIVSATGRHHLGLSTYEDFIQTDAAINPGNSGGALVNAYGHLVGINSAIFSKSGGSQGIGFAIPSNLTKQIMEDIIEHGEVIRGWLGVEMQQLTPQLAESFGVKSQHGMLVAGILRGGPASKAGLKPGDVLTHINDQAIQDNQEAMNDIAKIRPGTDVKLSIIRNGKSAAIIAIVGTKPKS